MKKQKRDWEIIKEELHRIAEALSTPQTTEQQKAKFVKKIIEQIKSNLFLQFSPT